MFWGNRGVMDVPSSATYDNKNISNLHAWQWWTENANNGTFASQGQVIQPSSHKDIISVRFLIIYGTYIATFLIWFFSLSIASFFPMEGLDRENRMLYISDGYQEYCGITVIIIGMSSMMIGLSQFIARCHMDDYLYSTTFFISLEMIGWFVVLGIQGTNMIVHKIALICFLCGNILFHWQCSRDSTFGNIYYRIINGFTIFMAIAFISFAYTTSIYWKTRETQSISVSMEFFLSLMVSIEQYCLLSGLDKFEVIHLKFEKRRREGEVFQMSSLGPYSSTTESGDNSLFKIRLVT